MGERATPAEIQQRITAILPYVMMGKTSSELVRIVALDPALKWGIKERQMLTYMQKAEEYLKQFAEIDRSKEIGKIRLRLEELFKMAVKDRDINQARLILRDYCDLFGLNAPSKMESDTKLEIIIRDAWKEKD